LCKAIEQRTEIGTEGTEDGEAKREHGGIVAIDEAPVSGILLLVTDLEGFLKENVGWSPDERNIGGIRAKHIDDEVFEGSSSARAINPSARTPSALGEDSRTQKSPFWAW
jgi:hypothetical protein